MVTSTTNRADAFYRARGKVKGPDGDYRDKPWQDQEIYDVSFPCTPEQAMDLGWLIEAARAAGAPKGTFQTGIFQIQTDLGIWSRPDHMRLSPGDKKSSLKTWAQLEAEELAGQAA